MRIWRKRFLGIGGRRKEGILRRNLPWGFATKTVFLREEIWWSLWRGICVRGNLGMRWRNIVRAFFFGRGKGLRGMKMKRRTGLRKRRMAGMLWRNSS